MEDHRLITMNGPVDFPHITVIGATTDSGLLPEPFLGRFGLSLQLDRYTSEEMALMALLSGRTSRVEARTRSGVHVRRRGAR
jgi:Holliday junction resolvasome RuvABC ATP-dependent DNA helicase subunit